MEKMNDYAINRSHDECWKMMFYPEAGEDPDK